MESKKSYVTAKDILLRAEIPQETKTYKPVTHQQLIDLTLESIHSAGFELEKETYSAARDGNVANGRYTIRNVADAERPDWADWYGSCPDGRGPNSGPYSLSEVHLAFNSLYLPAPRTSSKAQMRPAICCTESVVRS